MSPLEPIDPILESPLAHPLLKQRAVAAELLNEVISLNILFAIITLTFYICVGTTSKYSARRNASGEYGANR